MYGLLVSCSSNADSGARPSGSNAVASAANKKPNVTQVKDGPGIVKVEGTV